MRHVMRRLAVGTTGLMMAAGALSAGTAAAQPGGQPDTGTKSSAASCYGSAKSKTFKMGTDEAPHHFGPYRTANPKVCGDINLRLTKWGSANPLKAKVCFFPEGGGKKCTKTKNFTKKNSLNKWRVLASDVVPGTKYEIVLDFASHTFKGKLAD